MLSRGVEGAPGRPSEPCASCSMGTTRVTVKEGNRLLLSQSSSWLLLLELLLVVVVMMGEGMKKLGWLPAVVGIVDVTAFVLAEPAVKVLLSSSESLSSPSSAALTSSDSSDPPGLVNPNPKPTRRPLLPLRTLLLPWLLLALLLLLSLLLRWAGAGDE